MLNSVCYIFILILCCNLCNGEEKPPHIAVQQEKSDKFNTFDWALSKAVGAKAAENVVLSPVSVKLVLAMLYEGAGGNTRNQLEKVLDITSAARTLTPAKFSAILHSLQEDHKGYDITIATKLYIDQEAKPKQEFEKKIGNLYNTTIEKINFKNTPQAVSKINAWAKAVSKGHIQHLVSEADTRESTVMLLLNAVYFKGLWEHQFPANETIVDVFHKDGNSTVKTPFMKAVHNLKYTESAELKTSILRMPYVGGKFAMYIVLPFEKNGLQNVIAAINPDKLRAILPTMMEVPVQINLPKFHFEFATSLSPVLQQLGITDMFNKNANLSDIAEGPKELVVSNVIQKAGINVNEQGSTAYATTVVDLTSKFGEHAVEFNATHPFLFFIEDETTDTIIFVGKVVDPTSFGKPKVHGASSPPVNGDGIFNKNDEKQISLLDQQIFCYFDIELLQSLSNIKNVNWVTSPASIKSVLGLILEGASGNTLQQLREMLRLPDNKTLAHLKLLSFHNELQNVPKNVKMKSTSRILVHKDIGVKPNYKKVASESFGVDVENVDFSTPDVVAKQLNTWVNDVTQGLIPQILDPGLISSNSSLAFLNAIFFKGEWQIPFDPAATHLSCFYTSTNECKKTEFMKTSGFFKYGYVISLRARIIELLYNDPRYSMVILLPMERDGLLQTVRNLPFNSIFSILENLPYLETSVTLPKFSIEYSIDLVPLLQKLGASELFTEKANLEDILPPGKKSAISTIIHKAKLVVNERGSVAAAATAAVAETLMSRIAVQFKADYPFIFFIRDSRSGFLFEGVYSNPTLPLGQVEPLNSVPPLRTSFEPIKHSNVHNSPYPQPPMKNKIQNKRFS